VIVKNIKYVASVLCAGLLLFPAAGFSEQKVGFVNIAKLMEDAPQVKAATKKMEAEFAPREKELVALQRDIQKLEDKMARDSATMSESERNKVERETLTQKRELKRTQDEFKEDLNIRRNEEMSKLQRELFDAVVAVAKEQKYDLIVESAVYASDRIDITDAVLKRLSK
jgi:outer membrane protein